MQLDQFKVKVPLSTASTGISGNIDMCLVAIRFNRMIDLKTG